jgi:beta-N-acetylhexosaminidase
VNSISFEQAKKCLGRLVIGRLPGLVLDSAHEQALTQGYLGGITLFKENGSDLPQLAKLCKAIHKAAFHPPVLTVDQEGGAVQRFEDILSPLPSPMALAATKNPRLIKEIAGINASQLKSLGFNLLLAPTLDLLSNRENPIICTRALGRDIETINLSTPAYIEGVEEAGLIACGKHFPGHGSTREDSHLELALVDKSRQELDESDLVPFIKNLPLLRAVLIGHIWLPRLVSQMKPATLAPEIVNNLLKVELGFKGLIVSDDMTMKAITREFGMGEACVQAFLAGVDLILVCGTFEQSQEAVDALTQAYLQGRISNERLQHSLTLLDELFPRQLQHIINIESLKSKIEKDSQICLTASATGIQENPLPSHPPLPLPKTGSSENWLILRPEHGRYPLALKKALFENAGKFLNDLNFEELPYPLNPTAYQREELAALIKGRNLILLTFRAYVNSGQKNLLEQIAASNEGASASKLIHISCDSPFDHEALSSQPLKIPVVSFSTLDPSNLAMSALAAKLCQEIFSL